MQETFVTEWAYIWRGITGSGSVQVRKSAQGNLKVPFCVIALTKDE